MIDAFEWAGPGQVVFGVDGVQRIGALCGGFGPRALVVTGGSGRAETVLDLLDSVGIETVTFAVAGEPTTEVVEQGREVARSAGVDWVLAVGGGAVMDAGKALAALLANHGPVLDYLEVIGKGRALECDPLPFVALPTTAGTGAEATRNAVLGSVKEGVKVSLRHRLMLPRLALIDPQLAVTVPPALTATTGLDALTQLLEAFVCTRANPMTDMMCQRGIALVRRSLRRAVETGQDLDARSDMALAALFGGMALANAGLGAVHGFAAPLGGKWGVAHGAVCAALLPAVWKVNLEAVKKRGVSGQLDRFQQVAEWLTGESAVEAEGGVEWLRKLVEDLRIRGLKAQGVNESAWDEVIPLAMRASSMKANPVALTAEELRRCLEGAG